MNQDNKIFEKLPPDIFKDYWPFDKIMAEDLFFMNSQQSYYSLYSFLSDMTIENSTSGETAFGNFFIENNKSYYVGSYNKKYTLKDVPYSLIVCSAIKYQLNNLSEDYLPFYHWTILFQYLIFSTFPIKQILEEGGFIKTHKKNIIFGFYQGFCRLEINFKRELAEWFFDSKIKKVY